VKFSNEVFRNPETRQYSEELSKLLLLVWTLEDVELRNVGLSELLEHA